MNCTCDAFTELGDEQPCPLHNGERGELPYSMFVMDTCAFCGTSGHESKKCPNRPLTGPDSVSFGGLT